MSQHQKLAQAYRNLARDMIEVADLLDASTAATIGGAVPVAEPEAEKTDKKRKRKAAKDPNMPKHPKSAYILFSMDKRENVKKEMGDNGNNVRDVMTELARRWKALSDKEKQPYVSKAAVEKAQHEKAMEAYNAEKKSEAVAQPEKQEDSSSSSESSTEESSSSSSAASEPKEEQPQKKGDKAKLKKRSIAPSSSAKGNKKKESAPEKPKQFGKKKQANSSSAGEPPSKKFKKGKAFKSA